MLLIILGHALTNHAVDASRTTPTNTQHPGSLDGRDFEGEQLNESRFN
jgi:hypothetical protein